MSKHGQVVAGHDLQPTVAPSLPLRDLAMQEARYARLARTDPARSHQLMALAQAAVDERWRYHAQLAGIARWIPHAHDDVSAGKEES